MANVKISELPLASSITNTDVLAVVTGGVTKKTSAQSVIAGGFSGASANSIVYLDATKAPQATTSLYFDGTNIGLGTTTPSANIHVKASGVQTIIQNTNTGNQASYLIYNSTVVDAGFIKYASSNVTYPDHLSIKNYTAGGPITMFTNGLERIRVDASGNVGIGVVPVANNGQLQVNQHASIKGLLETVNLAGVPSGTNNIDVINNVLVYFNTAATQNFAVNIRGNSTTTLNTIMQTNQSVTVSFLVTNGSTAYYPNAFTIDGTGVSVKWQGGIAPTSGNANSVDVYTITIIKTAASTFTVVGSQTQFA